MGDLAREAQDLARRRPVLFIGSAFALGLLGARFLKSSAENGRASRLTSEGAPYGDAGAVEAGYGWSADPLRAANTGRL